MGFFTSKQIYRLTELLVSYSAMTRSSNNFRLIRTFLALLMYIAGVIAVKPCLQHGSDSLYVKGYRCNSCVAMGETSASRVHPTRLPEQRACRNSTGILTIEIYSC